MRFAFLSDTYETEALKVLSVWSAFRPEDIRARPRPGDPRGRSLLEHMVHQCQSEDLWFSRMLEISVGEAPLPDREEPRGFIRVYARHSAGRLEALRQRPDAWWEEEAAFFEVRRPRTWIVTRRIAHTAHHRGQQLALLRMLGRDLHSVYGPTADTGGLMRDGAPVVYPYQGLAQLLEDEEGSPHRRSVLPGTSGRVVTERPEA